MTATGTLEDGSWRFENRTSAVSRTEPHDCPKAIGEPEFDEIKLLVGTASASTTPSASLTPMVVASRRGLRGRHAGRRRRLRPCRGEVAGASGKSRDRADPRHQGRVDA